jgi:hypothetical protein
MSLLEFTIQVQSREVCGKDNQGDVGQFEIEIKL